MTLEQIISTGLPALGAVVGIAIFLWRRYQGLEKRFRQIETRIVELGHNGQTDREAIERKILQLDHRGQMTREAMQSTDDMHLLQINGNRELIEHRTQRFCSELKALEERLAKDLDEVKRFLERTTEFTIRH